MPLNPPRRNKNTGAQQFSKRDLEVWEEQLKCLQELEEVHVLFQDVFQATTQKHQLVALKKISPKLTSLSPDSVKTVLCVLVELHSRCSSRHPLQRAVASLLQSQCEDSLKTAVSEHISMTIQALLRPSAEESVLVNDQCLTAVHYIEVLMENFIPGQQALEGHLPMVLEFCVTTLMSFRDSEQDRSNTVTTLIALLKTASTLLLKFSQQLHLMLTASDALRVHWPDSLKSSEEKGQWTEHKMGMLAKASEDLLMSTEFLPHDATVSAAMLIIATLNLTLGLHPPSPHDLMCASQKILLSLCHALLAKLPLSVMVVLEMEGQPLLVALFQLVTKLSSSFTESSERFISSRTLALWTSVARECASVVGVGSSLYQALLPSGDIMTTLLQYIWALWEDPIDGIRHQCREMFENIIKTYKQLQLSGGEGEDFLHELARTLLSLDSPTRGRFVLLSSLSAHVPPGKILQISPQLPSQLMAVMGHQALACHAGDLWGRLVALHWTALSGSEDSESTWSEMWITPLVETMCNGDQLALKHITQHCLPALFKCCDKSLAFVTSQLDGISERSSSNKTLTARLSSLHCAKTHFKEGLPDTHSLEELFISSMYHANEQVRLSALGLVCESVRTTESPPLRLLPLLLSFVELNANSQSPGFRYPVLTSFKKLFVRIRDSCYVARKAFQKSGGWTENPEQLVAGYQEFLGSLLEQLFSVLHPLSSFQRRNFSLCLLQTLASIFTPDIEDSGTQIPPVFEFEQSVTQEQAKCLVDGLRDPFDANRLLCLELLYKLKSEKIGLNASDYLTHCAQSFVTLVSSPKSVNCTSAAFLLRLLTHFSCAEFNSILSQQLSQATPNDEVPLIATLRLLCQLLRTHIALARRDLVRASINAPMYGVLQSIRAVVETIHWKPTPAAHEVVMEMVEISVQVSQVVSPVVCSSSPEGFLPDKGEAGSSETSKVGVTMTSKVGVAGKVQSTSSGTAQSLLLCCWHSMKEISLLLGYLAGETPVISEPDGNGGLLSEDQLEKISEVFIHQLTEARHRGAFEMAYTGFCKLCRCLWSSPSPQLSQKPSLWIHDLLDSLQTSSLAKLLSITRRSAGLPFYVQAILTSEPSHTGYTCSKFAIQTLLKVARSGLSSTVTTPTETGSPTHSQPAAVHALNILRSLYRESKLGDFVVPFIPEGVMIAIEGFSASLWPVRSSSTLLFSALVSRVFGAKRVQDEHSAENKMTSREFFTRFPTLYDFLLEQLKSSAAQLGGAEHVLLQPSLFPTLVLLSRLYPSPLDDDHTPFSLRPFVSHLVSCTLCPVWKTRGLVSRTLATLATTSTLLPLLQELYCKMELTNQNSLHGSLLVISIVAREREKLLLSRTAIDDREALAHWLLKAHLTISDIVSSHNSCGMTAQLYLDVLHALLELSLKTDPALSSLEQAHIDRLKTLLSDASKYCFNNHKTKKRLFPSGLCESYFQLLMLVASHRMEFAKTLNTSVLETGDLLHKAVAYTENKCLIRLVLKTLNSSLCDRLCVEWKDKLCKAVKSGVLVQTEKDSFTLAEAYSFLAKHYSPRGDSKDKVFVTALQLCLRPSNILELRVSLMHFIGHALPLLPPSQSTNNYLSEWISHLRAVSVPTQPFEIRIAVAEQLNILWDLALLSPPSLSALSMLIVTLLQDSDQDVRTQAAAAVTKILPDDVTHKVECLNPSQALRWFITHSLTKQVSHELSISVFISLITLLSQDDHTLLSTLTPHTSTSLTPSRPTPAHSTSSQPTLTHSISSPPTNILFDEDPINDYAEDTLVLQMTVKALVDIQPLSAAEASKLVEVLSRLVKSGEPRLAKGGSPWEDVSGFKARTRLRVLAPLFESVKHQLGEDSYPASMSQCADALQKLCVV